MKSTTYHPALTTPIKSGLTVKKRKPNLSYSLSFQLGFGTLLYPLGPETSDLTRYHKPSFSGYNFEVRNNLYICLHRDDKEAVAVNCETWIVENG